MYPTKAQIIRWRKPERIEVILAINLNALARQNNVYKKKDCNK